MKEKLKGIIIGIVIGVMITASSVIASSGAIQKLLHYNDIKITMNGNEIRPADANGNYVEPFIIDGTTYLPVRAVSNALGLYVDWDANTNTVKLSETPFAPEAENMTEVEAFISEYGDLLKAGFEEGFSESGLTCKTTVAGKGNDIIIETRIDYIDGLTEKDKAELQEEFNLGKEDLKAEFEGAKEDIPSLEKIIFRVCEEDGDLIATIEIEF